VAVGQFVPVECTKPLNVNKPVKHYPHSIKKALAQKKFSWCCLDVEHHCTATKAAYKKHQWRHHKECAFCNRSDKKHMKSEAQLLLPSTDEV